MPAALEKSKASNITIKLDSTHRDRLKSLATAKKRTPHYLMKEAIERYIDAEEAEQAALKIVDNSVSHYEMTGLHITLDEVKTWAKEVKTNRNALLPACHT
jgi:predicted transcriptional regulator